MLHHTGIFINILYEYDYYILLYNKYCTHHAHNYDIMYKVQLFLSIMGIFDSTIGTGLWHPARCQWNGCVSGRPICCGQGSTGWTSKFLKNRKILRFGTCFQVVDMGLVNASVVAFIGGYPTWKLHRFADYDYCKCWYTSSFDEYITTLGCIVRSHDICIHCCPLHPKHIIEHLGADHGPVSPWCWWCLTWRSLTGFASERCQTYGPLDPQTGRSLEMLSSLVLIFVWSRPRSIHAIFVLMANSPICW